MHDYLCPTAPFMSSALITIIVPVYNVAAYVGPCLASLQAQTYENFEVLMIDDGSTDGSGNIAAQVVAGDPRFQLVRQDNQGLSGARNTGLDLAQGDFIAFVDSDDRVTPDYLMTLWRALNDTGSDWVACAIRMNFGDGSSSTHSTIHGAPDLADHPVRRTYRLDTWPAVIRHFPSAWNKLYRRELLDGLRFDEGTWFEDHSFFYRVALRTDHLFYLPEPLYLHTRDREGQITDQDDDRIYEQFDVLRRMRAIMRDSKLSQADQGFAQIASRLIWERSMALKSPARRRDYAAKSAAFLAAENLTFSPEWDTDIAATWVMEMAGELPLSIVLPWDGRDADQLAHTLESVRHQTGPGREVFVICDQDKTARIAQDVMRASLQDWAAIETLVQPNRGCGAARAYGLARAQGRYVVFLNAGDQLHASVLQAWCDGMEKMGADSGLAQFYCDLSPDAAVHNGFDDMASFPTGKPASGLIDVSVQAALGTAPTLSNRIFRRSFLADQGLSFTHAAHSHWALCLGALLVGPVAYFAWPGVSIDPIVPHRSAPSSRFLRSHYAVLRALPAAAKTRLPKGWQRRLYARAVWHEVNQTSRSNNPRFIGMLASAAIGSLWCGYGGARRDPAGFDPSFGPGLAYLLHPLSLVAGPKLLPHTDVERQLQQNHAIYAFPLKGRGSVRIRADFETFNYANVSFLAKDGVATPFHLSLRQEEGVLVCNDNRPDGEWRAERHYPLPSNATNAEITIDISPPHLTVKCGGTTVAQFGRRHLLNRSGLQGLERIMWVAFQGGVLPLDLQTSRPGHALEMDGRLQLRARQNPKGLNLCAHPNGEQLPLIASTLPDGTTSLLGDVPGRVWQSVPKDGVLELSLTPNDTPPLRLTRQDMANRINDVLICPPSPADSTLALTLLDHVRYGELQALIAPKSLAILQRLAKTYGLSDYIAAVKPDDSATPLALAPDTGGAILDAALTRLHQSQHDTPAPDPFDVLAEISLPHALRRPFYLALCDIFCREGGDFTRLYDMALAQGVVVANPEAKDLWSISGSLSYLYLAQDYKGVAQCLARMKGATTGWILTPSVAWIARRACQDPSLPEPDRDAILTAYMAVFSEHSMDYWSRVHCKELTIAAVTLLLNRPKDTEVETFCLRCYGLSRSFWTVFDARCDPSKLTSRTALARDAFHNLTQAIEAQDRKNIDWSLVFFESEGCVESPRMRLELLGPAGLPDTVTAHGLIAADRTPELTALRYLATPGVQPTRALSNLAAQAIAPLYPETHHSAYFPNQQALADNIEAVLAHSENADMDALLDQLDALSGPWPSFLGIGLALSLVSAHATTPKGDYTDILMEWVLQKLDSMDTQDRAACAAATPVRTALKYPLPQSIHDALDVARGPAHIALSAGSPLYNTIVTIFSCRAYEGTRIPAIRSSWVTLLEQLGVPYVFVVGDGDGQQDGDIVRLDAPDDYEGLPQKTLATIRWVHENTTFGHMLKIDDDCFLNAELFFRGLSYRKFDYWGRKLTRGVGQMDRAWHQAKSTSVRGQFELDRSPEPSFYADGGSGYTLSRDAMAAALSAADSPAGQRLIQLSFMEDKMLGDLLALRGIHVAAEDYRIAVRRRTFGAAVPVASWVNSFFPSQTAPLQMIHLDNHTDQKIALERLDKEGLWPSKIWPSSQDVKLGYQSNALELLSDLATVETARTADVAVVAVMRNEMFMLPHFLAHYRALGVGSFLIADNLSDDGTREYLLKQPDVALFSVDTDYRLSHYGVAWQQAMMAAFRVGKWSLVADADELLVWQEKQTQTLVDLLKTPAFEGVDAARIFMLDMYPKGPLSGATFSAGTPFDEAGYSDAHPFLHNTPARGPYSDQPAWTSSLRHRLLPRSHATLFMAQKLALLRYQPFMRLSDGLHFVGDAQISEHELVFAHFKYNAAFRAKAEAEVARGQHFNDAEEYRKYLALASEGREVIYDPELSVPWAESHFIKDLFGFETK